MRRLRSLCLALPLVLASPPSAWAGKSFDPEGASANDLLGFLDHGSWEYRVDAAKEIGARCIKEADAKLAGLAEQDATPRVRLAALGALDRCRMPSALVTAETVSLVDAEASHRAKAIEIIESLGTERSGPVLSQVLAGDPDAGVRRKAAVVLRKKVWRGGEPVQEQVATSDPDAALRRECLWGLLLLDRARWTPLLHDAIKAERDDKARLDLVEILEKTPKPTDRDFLIVLLDDGYSHVARHAARALVNLGDRSVAEILRSKSMSVGDRKVAEEFAEAAQKLGG